MKIKVVLCYMGILCGIMMPSENVFAANRLAPHDFNKMYYLASQGRVGILRSAVNRGLNIDAVNARGDTGLCVAVKRKNYVAYNSFKMSGANPKHPCTYKMHRQYQEFLVATKNARERMVIGNKESLQYKEEERSWWPWILGGVAVGGAMSAFSGGGGSSAAVDNTIIPVSADDGLSSIVTNYNKLVDNRTYSNGLYLDASNPNASSVVNKISFLPNIADNYSYLNAYIKVQNGGYFENMEDGRLIIGDRTIGKSGDGAIGVAVDGKNSVATNLGSIKIDAFNGAIGMAASDEGAVTNGDKFGDYITGVGNIEIIFKGSKEGDAVIGMYADTNSEAINYGTIKASIAGASKNITNGVIDDLVEGTAEEGATEEEEVVSSNSGTILGMAVFDLYTGKDYSADEVIAKNYGLIDLTAGYNTATDVSVSLIGMGSYIDDKFLKGNSNPNFAEQMKLRNDGTINLSYQGAYKIGEEALKLGDGGLIGMRADAQSLAINAGDINIDMRATTIDSELDVAAGMLSVHGAELINNVNSKIHILNEATVGGVYYGMLAAKGDGSQTNLYKWKAPKLTNSGEIYMETSNSYGMASFAGGTLLNDGTIFLGVENGQSNYKNNYGMYADGSDKTEEVHLINEGLINVYSELSTAIYNAFSGSVYMENRGDIYISNKATGSKVFGGNYSALVNSGTISYKVGNSAEYVPVDGGKDKIGINVETKVLGSVIEVSGDSNTTKQTFTNTAGGSINIGDSWSGDKDYGGTYVTSGIKISKQGSAYNKGTINLNLYEKDIEQFNVGILLDDTTTAEAFAENYGTINVGATNSIGIRNDSTLGGIARNFADINVTGTYGYGMSARSGASIFNGLSKKHDDAKINVDGIGSIGMYVEGKDTTAYNYGTINLNGASTTAFQLKGAGSRVENEGEIIYRTGLDDITFFWMTDGASKEFVYKDGIDIVAYTLGKATDGGIAYFSESSVAYVSGQNSHLFVAEDQGSAVYNKGIVDLENAVAMIGRDGASVINVGNAAKIDVKDETSIGIEVKGEAVATNDSGALINVNKGIGIKATEFSRANNFATINVEGGGTGIYLLHGDGNKWSTGDNRGTITVVGADSKGVDVGVGSVFINKKIINVSTTKNGDKAYGIYSQGDVTTDQGSSINVGQNSYGIYVVSGGVDNSGNISVSTSDSYGIYSEGAPVNNYTGGVINVSSGTGIYAASGTVTNGGIVEVTGDGVGIEGYVVNNNIINVSNGDGFGIKGDGVNNGDINATYAVGVDIKNKFINNLNIRGAAKSDKGIVNVNSNARFDNNGNIIVSSGPGSGVLNNGGVVTNNGTIDVTGRFGVTVDGGTMTNYSEVNVLGTESVGIRVVNGIAQNEGLGTIEVAGNEAIGMLIEGGAGSNTGLIQVTGKKATGVWVKNGEFTNTGTIEYASKEGANPCIGVTCGGQIIDTSAEVEQTSVASNLVYVEQGAEFVNNGKVIYNDLDVNFDDIKGEEAAFVVGKGGTYTASSFEGDVKAGTDIVKGGFEDVYVNENSFVGENNGLNVTSKSYMFDAVTNVKDGVTDVELNRKRFEDIIEEKQLAEFFEINYNLNHNEKMYDSLKSATNEKEFSAAVKDETGEKFYANLPRENIAVLRGLASNEQTRVLQDGLKEKTVGANFFRTGKDGDSGLSDYEDDVYSAYIGFGSKLNNNWSVGGTFMAGYVDSSYDDISSNRENKILMAFMPILYQNDRFKYLATPHIGFGLGSYKRHAGSGDYKADTFDIYYGVSNHAEYSLDVKVAELVWEAELNMLGIKSDDMEEKDGFVLKSHDTLSLEAGLGVKLRKKIEFDKKRSLMLAVGTRYYQELLDPYEQLDKTIKGSPVSLNAGRYDEDKQRVKTTIEALYKDGDMSVGAEISHNKEKKSNIEGGLGIRYNF